MAALAFFDTNILVYSVDDRDTQKQTRALELWHEHLSAETALISIQVLQEYYRACTQRLGIEPAVSQALAEEILSARVVRLTGKDVIAAIEIHRLRQISIWDALIVKAAILGGASVLYTEDLQHGSTISGVKIVNPFA